ncbi:MAG: amino acid ABC transporter permease [Beijerinckiaceae bacterium]
MVSGTPGVGSPAKGMAKSVAERRFHAGGPPRNPTRRAVAAAIIGVLAVAAAAATLLDLRDALASLDVSGIATDLSLFALGIIAAAVPLVPALLGLARAGQSRLRLNEGDVIGARVQAAASRNASSVSLGLAATQILVLLAILFLIANDLAVSRTFFYLPQIRDSLVLILKAFWINIYIFMIAEVLVLIWGLAVAIARLAPGAGGRPIRLIATFYVDLFRGLPAIVNVYLIGFGIPLTGLPILKDLSQESFAILALTLTSGAYVAEVYRAGIESIHWSQTAAARSLGLSYMQALRFVIVPQGVRQIIPPLLNNFISLQKDTALVNVIGTIDAFNQSIIIASNHFNLSAVTTVAILFFVITIPQARFVDRMVERDRQRTRAGLK